MGKLFFRMPCLSESHKIKSQEIYERLFDKRVDKRYLESAVQKFLLLNKKMFSFAGITLEMDGVGSDLSIKFKTVGFIGAIPVRMPYDGIAHKDFQITPRFDNAGHDFSDLTQLLSRLDYSISPEYADGEELSLPLQLRPPMYYEAAKYIDLFEAAHRQNWVKFEVVKKNHRFPKTNTNWPKYIESSFDPLKSLIYPATDSVLSRNHNEWQELIYVFEIAKSIILRQDVPESIRYRYRDKIMAIQKKNASINPIMTGVISIHSNDPYSIKEVKEQANVLLQKGVTSFAAWRIDMATLFEHYVQYVVGRSLIGLDGAVVSNRRISGRGPIPRWGVKYLEPDMIIRYNSSIYMADAKYKANYYVVEQASEILRETHRLDLHQLLAYCSFSPDKEKIGILFYPFIRPNFRKIDYLEQHTGISNTVYLFGIPFGINGVDTSVEVIRQMFQGL